MMGSVTDVLFFLLIVFMCCLIGLQLRRIKQSGTIVAQMPALDHPKSYVVWARLLLIVFVLLFFSFIFLFFLSHGKFKLDWHFYFLIFWMLWSLHQFLFRDGMIKFSDSGIMYNGHAV